jgi:predicted XRE-type DNA-binding protein
MAIHKWKDIRAKNRTPEEMARVDDLVHRELLQMAIRELRESVGLTQEELATKMAITQAYLSKLERHGVDRISILKTLVEAVGGRDMEITAVIQGKRVRLAAA